MHQGEELDSHALDDAVAMVSSLAGAHAGGIELAGVSDDGTVRVRFTGACTGCPFRPLTTAGTVRPVLLAVAGVQAVETEGSRISAEAEARLASYLGSAPSF